MYVLLLWLKPFRGRCCLQHHVHVSLRGLEESAVCSPAPAPSCWVTPSTDYRPHWLCARGPRHATPRHATAGSSPCQPSSLCPATAWTSRLAGFEGSRRGGAEVGPERWRLLPARLWVVSPTHSIWLTFQKLSNQKFKPKLINQHTSYKTVVLKISNRNPVFLLESFLLAARLI